MLNLRLCVLFVAFLFYITTLAASIIETFDLENFKIELLALNDQSLVIFDVDETLITPKDPFFRGTPNLPTNCRAILQNFGEMDFFLENEVLKYWREIWIGKICNRMQFQLVDTEFPNIIQKLQKNGVKAIALTAIISTSFGIIPSIADWRIKQLQDLGIDFSQAFSDHPIFTVNVQSNDLTFKHGFYLLTKPLKERPC